MHASLMSETSTLPNAALARMQTLLSITETALTSLDLDEVLRALLPKIVEELGLDTAVVLLLADDNATLVARAAHGLEEEVASGVRIPLGSGFAGQVAAERRPIVLDDVARANVINPMLREKGLHALAGVPLLADGRILGVLHVGSLGSRKFTPADVHFLELIAARIATAIEHARLYEAAREARTQAAEATEALLMRDEFLSAAAHELKTPMTAVKIAAQLLRRSLNKTHVTAAQERALTMLEGQIARQARLVSHLLDMVRLGRGQIDLELEPVDVAALVRSVASVFEALSEKHQLAVHGPERLVAEVDAMRLEQVVTNLIENAVKYSPNGGQIEITLTQTPATFVLSVRDHGLGVPPEHLPKIFDRFYQAHKERSGLGLGLYISRQIVERHGGTMYAETPPDGEGTRFVVSAPLAATPLSSSAASSSSS